MTTNTCAWAFAALLFLACSSEDAPAGGVQDAGTMNDGGSAATDSGSGNATTCTGMCTSAGYTGGDEQEFTSSMLVECRCTGTGTRGITQMECVSYCSVKLPRATPLIDFQGGSSIANKCSCEG